LEHVDGLRQIYDSAASWAVRDLSHTAVRLDNCFHKGKSETMAGRILSLYESFENLAADIGRESRTIIFNH
jgi:hypothetical protein